MEISDIIKDRLSVTIDKLEQRRPGILLRAIDEARAELNYLAITTDLEKLHIGLYAALKLARSAIDLYQEELFEEQSDDVRNQYQDRIRFLQEKIKQIQTELASIAAILMGDPAASPPCYKIEKSNGDTT